MIPNTCVADILGEFLTQGYPPVPKCDDGSSKIGFVYISVILDVLAYRKTIYIYKADINV